MNVKEYSAELTSLLICYHLGFLFSFPGKSSNFSSRSWAKGLGISAWYKSVLPAAVPVFREHIHSKSKQLSGITCMLLFNKQDCVVMGMNAHWLTLHCWSPSLPHRTESCDWPTTSSSQVYSSAKRKVWSRPNAETESIGAGLPSYIFPLATLIFLFTFFNQSQLLFHSRRM